jgi:hypothetical protein
MSSYYASSSTIPYNYQPVSPPWSHGGSPPPHQYDGPPRAPVMPYAALPPVPGYAPHTPMSPHCMSHVPLSPSPEPWLTSPTDGLITPPPTPGGEQHPALAARPTVVRYDFGDEPRNIRMSSSSRSPSFPHREPISKPELLFLTILCEVSGKSFTIRNDQGRHGITCADLFFQLHQYLARPIPPSEWVRVQGPQRHAMKAACARRTAGFPEQHPTMKMIDYLEGHTLFRRFVPDHTDRSGSTWILQTTTF